MQKSFVKEAIGVDLGFGYTKSMGAKMGLKVFTSLVTPGNDGVWDAGLNNAEGYRLQWGNSDYFVGEVAAVKSRTAIGNRSRERIHDDEAMALFYGALADQFPGGADNVIALTGLPIRWMPDKEVYKTKWPGVHTVTVNGVETTWNVIEVLNAPQGFGAICDAAIDLNESGGAAIKNPKLMKTWTVVGDIGTLTYNVFAFNQSQWVERSSDSFELGMSWLYPELRTVLNEEFGVMYEDHEIDSVIREGSVEIEGQTISTHNLITPWLHTLAREQARATQAKIGEDFKKIPQVLISGGGAHRLGAMLKTELDHAGAIITKDPGWTNARGFYKWGVLRTQ